MAGEPCPREADWNQECHSEPSPGGAPSTEPCPEVQSWSKGAAGAASPELPGDHARSARRPVHSRVCEVFLVHRGATARCALSGVRAIAMV